MVLEGGEWEKIERYCKSLCLFEDLKHVFEVAGSTYRLSSDARSFRLYAFIPCLRGSSLPLRLIYLHVHESLILRFGIFRPWCRLLTDTNLPTYSLLLYFRYINIQRLLAARLSFLLWLTGLTLPEVMYRTSVSRLALLHFGIFGIPTHDLIIILLALPKDLDVLACPLGQKSRFLIFCSFIVIDYHLHHLFLGAVKEEHIWVSDTLACLWLDVCYLQQRWYFTDLHAEIRKWVLCDILEGVRLGSKTTVLWQCLWGEGAIMVSLYVHYFGWWCFGAIASLLQLSFH